MIRRFRYGIFGRGIFPYIEPILDVFDALLTEPDESGDVYFITEEDDADYYIKLETEVL